MASIKTPTLFLQEGSNERVATGQSKQLYIALKSNKIPIRLVYYDGQGHGFDSSVATRDAMNETLTWMKTHVGKQ